MSYDFHKVSHIQCSKKDHRCCETGALIPAGSPYVRYSGVSEGDFYSEVMHPDIFPIYQRRNDEACKHRDEPIYFGSLHEELEAVLSLEDPQSIKDVETFCQVSKEGDKETYLRKHLDRLARGAGA